MAALRPATETPLSDEAVRVMHLVALDAGALVRRLDKRRPEMLSAFSRLRDREALLGATHAFGLTARFEDVSSLPAPVQDAVVHFYELADELRWYFRFTTDMPGALALRFDAHRRQLGEAYEALARALEAATMPAPRQRLPAKRTPIRKRQKK